MQKTVSIRSLFEKKSRLIKVREKYMEAFEQLKDVENIVIIDGNRSEEEIAEEIWKNTSRLWNRAL